MAPRLDNPALMEGKGAKTAAAEAAAVTDQAELNLRYGRNAACRLIGRVIVPHIRKGVNIIHLFFTQWPGRRILHHIKMLSVRLNQPSSREGVRITVLGIKALCIFLLVRRQLPIGWQHHFIVNRCQGLRPVNRAVNKRDIPDIDAAVQRIGYLHNGALPHAVG